ncbi:hypothetical protein ASE73_05325 [Sphingomonas sp. Leaf24]|uniref:hypothetical protein n=1 Tax=unclassified Sphingomonas TaxID=196159 RepID=UPI0006FC461C|nr:MULTISPECIES: hypothetical protein [unclassified Sphingomonas]KQM21119.1 hypothetical protein ASE50_14065 [Sphingomonas sp. Leaf5]KQM89667.1 hypothetical protein ASE73_05325 [Sphingomonas sp. Leaf24]
MKRTIRHRCGHTQHHDIFAFTAADQTRTELRLERQRCTDCMATARAEQAAADRAAIAGHALPPLTGSARQVAWADTIRAERLAKLVRSHPACLAGLAAQVDAKWWIDHRRTPDDVLMQSTLRVA